MNKTILLTGATGYLGSHIAVALLDNGYEVVIIKRKHSSMERLLAVKNRIQSIDVEDLNWESLFKQYSIDGIIHTATNYGRGGELLDEIYQSNVMFASDLLLNALKYGVDFLINTATSLPRYLNAYSLTKSIFADTARLFSSKMKVVNVVPEYIYGPQDDKSKFISGVMDKIKNHAEAIDFTAGTQLRDFIYINDAVEAYMVLVRRINELPSYIDVALGTSQRHTLKSVVQLIDQKLGGKTILNFGALPFREGEVDSSCVDLSVLEGLGWKPKIKLENGIDKTIMETYK